MQKGLSLRSFLAEGGQTQVLILAGIVILIAVAGGIFFLGRLTAPKPQTQTPVATPQPSPSPLSTKTPAKVEDPTANWKTYTNTKIGFQIKYPPRFGPPVLPSGLDPTIYADGSEDKADIIFGEKTGDSYSLIIFPYNLTLIDLLNERKTKRAATPDLKLPVILPDIPTKLVKTFSVADVETNWYTNGYENGKDASSQEVHFIGRGYGFIFRRGENVKQQELDQILSTFRFD